MIVDSNNDSVIESKNVRLSKDDKSILTDMVLKIHKRFPKIELGWCAESEEAGSGYWKLSFGPEP